MQREIAVRRWRGKKGEGMKSVDNEQKLGKVIEVREVTKKGVGAFKFVDDLLLVNELRKFTRK